MDTTPTQIKLVHIIASKPLRCVLMLSYYCLVWVCYTDTTHKLRALEHIVFGHGGREIKEEAEGMGETREEAEGNRRDAGGS